MTHESDHGFPLLLITTDGYGNLSAEDVTGRLLGTVALESTDDDDMDGDRDGIRAAHLKALGELAELAFDKLEEEADATPVADEDGPRLVRITHGLAAGLVGELRAQSLTVTRVYSQVHGTIEIPNEWCERA